MAVAGPQGHHLVMRATDHLPDPLPPPGEPGERAAGTAGGDDVPGDWDADRPGPEAWPSWTGSPGPWPPAFQSPWPAPAPGYGQTLAGPGGPGGPGGALPPGMYYDEASGVVLPAGVELASAGRRVAAWFVAIPLAIVTLGIGYLVWGLVVWGRGQTPALQVLGMRCWRPESGRVAGWWEMALREVIGGLVDNLLNWVTLLTSVVLMLVSRDRKCLHDLVAGTVVVRDPARVLDRC